MYMYQKKIIKIENSLLATFDEMPCIIANGTWPNFGATFKICKKSILIEISSSFLHLIHLRP